MLLAVISGGEMSAATAGAVTSMDFKEYQRCLAFCAMTLLRNCAEFSAADRTPQRDRTLDQQTGSQAGPRLACNSHVGASPWPGIAVFLELYLDESMNLSTAESMRTPTDAIAGALKVRLASKIARFVPPDERRPASERTCVPRQFRQCWARMELSSTHGWPLWEAEVYGLLAESFSEIHAIFCYYGRSGSTTAGGSSASAALTLQRSEMANLAFEIELAHKNFPMVRRHPPAAPSHRPPSSARPPPPTHHLPPITHYTPHRAAPPHPILNPAAHPPPSKPLTRAARWAGARGHHLRRDQRQRHRRQGWQGQGRRGARAL